MRFFYVIASISREVLAPEPVPAIYLPAMNRQLDADEAEDERRYRMTVKYQHERDPGIDRMMYLSERRRTA